jgi:acyl transferase domain-containing protein/NADPH:quinone reductase-like Zn-dependent oxidoreductase/acyl carrier protein
MDNESVAIVGLGCRLPGSVGDPQGLWKFLLAKGDGITDVPADRWNIDRFYDADPDAPGRMYVRRGGFLTQSLWEFDNEYFGISAREASIMDPQQRLLLEVAVEALDDAGLNGRVGGREVGVYVGGFMADNQVGRHTAAARRAIDSHVATSGTHTMLSNRLSYVLDLVGPSLTIDTACSSSLVAFHEAVCSVQRGESEIAIAAGTNAMLRPETFVSMCKGRFLAADGRCKTFDASADGYARGEGAGAIVLKPLSAAIADGDRVYAVVAGSGVNQDGHTSGITVPNPVSQAALARRVLAQTGLSGADISYVEAHGTGTSIGDPLEMEALGGVFGNLEDRRNPLWVGSIKASIGHTEATAGVASLLKAILMLQHGTVPPQAWLENLNPEIPFDEYKIRIPTEAHALPHLEDGSSFIAVNGFGYGGTNAHVILGTPPASATGGTQSSEPRESINLLPISGRGADAVREMAGRLADQVDTGADLDGLIDAAWSRRAHHATRTAVPFTSAEDLTATLRELADGKGSEPTRVVPDAGEKPVFVFSGMGPQWWAMGRGLLAAGGTFARVAREIDERFIPISGWSVLEELGRDEADSRVTQTEIAQPANFLLQVALSAQLAELGITPAAVLGHSVGEVSAAYISGALSLDEALLVSYHRARLQATTAGSGSMLAVGLPESEVLAWLDAESTIDVAAVNSQSAVTLAGPEAELDALAERLTDEGIFARRLQVPVPYHSRLMDPILDDVADVLAPLHPRVPALPLVSSVTGQPVEGANWGASYWVDNVRQPVRFAEAIGNLIDAGHRVFLEVGPHPVLSGSIREMLAGNQMSGTAIPTLHRKQEDSVSLPAAVAGLYAAGCIDASVRPGRPAGEPVPHAELPSYPWQRTELWSEPQEMIIQRLGDPSLPTMLGARVDATNPEWDTDLSSGALPWLADHVVDGHVLLPGAAYLDAALSAADQLGDGGPQIVSDVRFVAPLVIDGGDVPLLRVAVEPGTGRFTIRARAATGTSWAVHATGRIVLAGADPVAPAASPETPTEQIDGAQLYQRLDARGLHYGPSFRRVQSLRIGAESVVAEIDNPFSDSGHLVHPAIVDAALHSLAALAGDGPDQGPVVPARVASVRRFGPLPSPCRAQIHITRPDGMLADITLTGEDGTVALELVGVELAAISSGVSPVAALDALWREARWEELEASGTAQSPVDPGMRRIVVTIGGEPAPLAAVLGERAEASPIAVGHALTDDVHLHALTAEDARARRERLSAAVQAALEEPGVTAVQIVVIAGAEDVGSTAGLAGLATVAQTLSPFASAGGSAGFGPRLSAVVITAGAAAAPGDTGPVNLAHAGLLGARRVLRNEQPDVDWRLIDTDDADVEQVDLELQTIAAEPEDAEAADEIALRDGRRFIYVWGGTLMDRLAGFDEPAPLLHGEQSFRVQRPDSSLLSDLALRAIPRQAPQAAELEVRIDSAGLNYKDPLKVIGMLGAEQMDGTYFGTGIGMECLGEVVRAGSEVDGFAVGDRVFIGVPDSLRRYLTLDPKVAVIRPAPTTWSNFGCASFTPYFTAHYALKDAARVIAGETVLVHGAAGGVGMAAVRVAKQLGATVIGTASTPERRALVLEAGADHVLESRTIDFVAAVRELTGGHGVDVVLNSAPGEMLAASLEAATEGGRVVEIGKAGIYTSASVGLAGFDRNLSLIAIDLDRLINLRRAKMDPVLDAVLDEFESGSYLELPTTVYGVDRLTEAFEATLASSHPGRVALDFSTTDIQLLPELPELVVDSGARHLITGGFGSFGLATAEWLAGTGARHLVLAGRSGASSEAAVARVQALRDAGVEVEELSLDIADPDAVDAMITALAQDGPPLRGVFHAAGVLDDGPVAELTQASLNRVLAPKVRGAWNLHAATLAAGIELDHFVLYSSIAAITGNVPQYTYAAANTILDELAFHRRLANLTAVSVNWGPLSGGGGMAEADEQVARYLELIGIGLVDMGDAAAALGEILRLDATHLSISDTDWLTWASAYPLTARTPRFAELIAAARSGASGAEALQEELRSLPEEERTVVIAYMLAEHVAAVLGMPAETVDLETPLPDLGLDSLMAVELGTQINLSLGLELSALDLSRGLNLQELAAHVTPALIGGKGGARPQSSDALEPEVIR